MATFTTPDTTDYAAIYNASAPAGAGTSDLVAQLARLGLTPADLAGASDAVLRALASALLGVKSDSGAQGVQPGVQTGAQGGQPGVQPGAQDGQGQATPPSDLRGEAANQWNMTHLLAALEAAAANGQTEVAFTNSAGDTQRWATNPETIAQLKANIAASALPPPPYPGAQVVNPRFDALGNGNPNYNPNLDPYGFTAAQNRLIADGDQVQVSPGVTAPGPNNKGLNNSLGIITGLPPDVAAKTATYQNNAARRQIAIPKLEGYIKELSAVRQPSTAQAAELTAYQKRLEEYQKTAPAPPVATSPSPTSSASSAKAETSKSAAPTVGSGTPPVATTSVSGAAPKVDYASKAAAADAYYTLSAKSGRTAADNTRLAELRKQLAAP